VHRFGRSGQLKKDRWGGSFILIAGIALAAAYFAGDYLNKTLWKGQPAATDNQAGDQSGMGLGEGTTPAVSVQPAAFNLYTVQVGAFKSPSGAQVRAQEINGKGHPGFANINTSGTSYAYAGAVFTDKEKAKAYLDELKAAKIITDGFVATLKVPYGPEAITAMAGENKSSVESGYSSLNTYLHEVAMWTENRANGTNDPVADMVSLGRGLASLATTMEKANLTDEKMTQFVALAKEAGQHAELLQSAANTMDTSAEYMKALNGYVSLLAHYNNLQASTTASNQ
jgi:hypothetical protein